MSQVEDLLNSLDTPDELDTEDTTLVIDEYLRTIQIPKSITNLGVESDDDVMRLYFKVPATYCGIDLSQFAIRINYRNAKNEGDVYEVTDAVKVDDSLIFSWLVGRNATLYKGNIRFIVCMKELDADGNVRREFNTTVATLPVLEGIETGEEVVYEHSDLLEQWRATLFGTLTLGRHTDDKVYIFLNGHPVGEGIQI